MSDIMINEIFTLKEEKELLRNVGIRHTLKGFVYDELDELFGFLKSNGEVCIFSDNELLKLRNEIDKGKQ